jgi:DNA-binding NarL/FixJ family response regulator
MLSTNINDYDYTERERMVLDLYNQGRTTRDIAKDLRLSLSCSC